MSSDICLQARYDLEIMFKMKINRNRPLILGRGRGTRISDTKCSREQVKISMLVPEKRRIGKKTDPLCLEIQPTHRFLTVHYHEEDSLEEIKKGDTAILQVGDSFSMFDTYFWFTLCSAESLNDVLDDIERKLEPHLVESEPKPKAKAKTTSTSTTKPKVNNNNNAITDTTIKIKLVSPNPTRISERLGKQKTNTNKTFDVPPIIITSRENSGSDEDFIDTINDAEPPVASSFLNAVKTNLSNSKKKVVNNINPKKPHENFDAQKSTKSNKSKYTEESGEERDEGDDDSSYGQIHSEEYEESIEGNDKIDTLDDKQDPPSNKRKMTQTKSKNAKRVRS